jgi:hypothetical protein
LNIRQISRKKEKMTVAAPLSEYTSSRSGNLDKI